MHLHFSLFGYNINSLVCDITSEKEMQLVFVNESFENVYNLWCFMLSLFYMITLTLYKFVFTANLDKSQSQFYQK